MNGRTRATSSEVDRRWRDHFDERLQYYRRVATGRRMLVLSGRAGSVFDNLTLMCAFGHTFERRAKDLLRGIGCPQCRAVEEGAFRLRQLEDAQRLAGERGGKCLAEEYVNARVALPWRCQRRHEWCATLDNVRRGHWCGECARMERFGRARAGRKRSAQS